MKIQPKALTDAELLNAARRQAEKGTVFTSASLAAERSEVTEYYLGERPLPMREGGSKFVSQDVYLSVENMKAELTETFGAGSQIVQFRPQGPDDLAQAKHATAYCEVAVHQQNDGLLTFMDVVHDGLTARAGFAKVYWEKGDEVTGVYQFSDAPFEQAAMRLQAPNVRLTGRPKVTEGPDGQRLISGEFEEFEDTSQVRIEAVPSEELIIGGRTRNLQKARYLAHKYRTSLGDLVDDGYDPKVVYSITGGDDDLALDEEALQREMAANGGTFLGDDDADDAAGRMVTVYESYIRIDALGTGSQQLWKIVHCGDTLLEKQRVNTHPFVAFVPQPIPHVFMGTNYAARTINHANTKTTLIRAIIEQAVDATNPRWQVARGGVANPRELIDNRRGGVVNVRDVNSSIAPLPQQAINPMVMQTVSMVDSDREDTTGISRLATGLDKKALSHQNSSGLVEQLTANSKTRAKVIARLFALQFVSQLYLKVYQLALENESQQRMLEIGGQFVPVDPRTWRARRDVAVDMTLGYGERDQRVSEMAELHQVFQGSPKLERMYGEQQAYALWRDTLEIKGIKNIGDYLADPSTLGEAQPDPKMMAEVDKLKKETEVLDRQQTLRENQVQSQIAREQAELEWKRITGQAEHALRAQEADRKDRETNNRIDIGLAELELAVDAQVNASPENTRLTAIASPNS